MQVVIPQDGQSVETVDRVFIGPSGGTIEGIRAGLSQVELFSGTGEDVKREYALYAGHVSSSLAGRAYRFNRR